MKLTINDCSIDLCRAICVCNDYLQIPKLVSSKCLTAPKLKQAENLNLVKIWNNWYEYSKQTVDKDLTLTFVLIFIHSLCPCLLYFSLFFI